MIKLIIFDLDGVLVKSKEAHFNALNRSLEKVNKKYVISYAEHLSIFDGLPTNKKLQILSKTKKLRGAKNDFNETDE
jgi:beta-phosphoglucomutase-like phosphatase (HAD superfamily)